MYYLVPVGFGHTCLNTIEVDTSNIKPIVLGRNRNTIKDSETCIQHIESLSRNHAEIVYEGNQIYVKSISTQPGTLHKNGQICDPGMLIPLSTGDTISLLGSLSAFNYKLKKVTKRKKNENKADHEIFQDSTQNQSQSVKTDTNGENFTTIQDVEFVAQTKKGKSSVKAVTESSTKAIQEHLECVICCNLMAFSHSLSPCGDSYCYECILSWSCKKNTCPTCQSDFLMATTVPNRRLDNIIREVLEEQKISGSDKEDAELLSWEQRVSQGKTLKRIVNDEGLQAVQSKYSYPLIHHPVPNTVNPQQPQTSRSPFRRTNNISSTLNRSNAGNNNGRFRSAPNNVAIIGYENQGPQSLISNTGSSTSNSTITIRNNALSGTANTTVVKNLEIVDLT
jgi:pSer/pThr/pTyr-binding forkhead associated (FHA) protein